MDPYSGEKALWHLDRIQALREGKDAVPTHLQLIISDTCNESCKFCAYRREDGFSYELFHENGNINPNRKIPFAKIEEILGDCEALGVKAVQFTGGGEPTVHPMAKYVFRNAINRDLHVGLVTNGTRYFDEFEGMKWVRVSLDCGTEGTYEKIRRSKKWHDVMENLRRLGQIQGPLVGVGFVMTRENFNELYRACEIVKDFGIPYVRVSAMFSHQGSRYYKYMLPQCKESIKRAKTLEDDTFQVIDLFSNRIADLDAGAPDYGFCGYQQFTSYIGADLKVYTCCTNAYTLHGIIGDLKDQSYAEWLAQHRRYDFDARSCHHCQFHDKNRAIGRMLSEPDHIFFV